MTREKKLEPLRAEYTNIKYQYQIGRRISSVSIYSLSDLDVSSNLIGSLSPSNWATYGVYNAWSKQNKMAGENWRFTTISEADLLKIQEDAVLENSKKASKSVVEITAWIYTN